MIKSLPGKFKPMLSAPCRRRGALFLAVLIAGLGVCQPARADTVASLLGNFTINQFAQLKVGKKQVKLHFVVVLGQLPALTALHKADTNHDGVTSQAERDAYVKRLAPTFSRHLKITVTGKRLPLHLASWTSSLPSESTGFSLRLDAYYTGKLPAGLHGPIHHLKFDNTNYAGRIGWHEIVVKPGSGISIFDTNAVSTSMTKGLSINPHKLPPDGPLDERAVHLAFTAGSAPMGVAMLQPRKGYPGDSNGHGLGEKSGIRATGVAATWINHFTKKLVDLISARHVAPGVALLALLFAMALGAVHAFSPGHGKTVVGAYLIGSRGTPRHALFLGLTVTITHTIGVFAVGLATLFASEFIVPEKLFPILSLISGLLVLGIGLTLFIRRFRGTRKHSHAHASAPIVAQARQGELVAAGAGTQMPVYPHPHGHEHSHDHGHEHDHSHHAHSHDHHGHSHENDALTHSHGGRVHTHLPPGAQGEKISWRSLLGLGISGGLIPCPSAMILLLATIALHKTAYGLVMVLAFSVGLAITLSSVGLAFLYARRIFGKSRIPNRLVRVLPTLSAGFITCIGAVICYGAIAGVSIRV